LGLFCNAKPWPTFDLASCHQLQQKAVRHPAVMSSPITTVSAVIVCYHPDPEALDQLIQGLQSDVHHIWLIHNSPQPQARVWHTSVRHVQCSSNIGVAGALNLGFDQAYAHGADAVIGFDQDSEPPPGLVAQLRASWNAALQEQPGRQLAAIGPALQDKDAGHLLHTFAPYNWQRRRLQPSPGICLVVDHLITSGCLIPRSAWQVIGPTNESLFIDWVDVEWCGRARHAGHQLLLDGDATLPHRIGQKSSTFMGRHFHVHSPFRHYFVLRNAILLWSDKRFSTGWRAHHLLYALRVILANLVFAPGRLQRLNCVARGWRDGWAKRTGAQGQIAD
jgi:rhamnosyltransferase